MFRHLCTVLPYPVQVGRIPDVWIARLGPGQAASTGRPPSGILYPGTSIWQYKVVCTGMCQYVR